MPSRSTQARLRRPISTAHANVAFRRFRSNHAGWLFWGWLLGIPLFASALTPPAGWKEISSTPRTLESSYAATSLPTDEFAVVRRGPRFKLEGASSERWLINAASNDSAPTGSWSGNPPAPKRQTPTLVTTSRDFVHSSERHGVAIYFAVSRTPKEVRLFRATFSSESIGRGQQGTAAREIVAEWVREELASRDTEIAVTTETNAPPTVVTPPATSNHSPKEPTPPPALTTAPGAGVPSSEIETVFYHWDQRYDAFQGLVLDEAVYLLLKDGTAYDGFKIPPEDFDVAASRRAEPKRWGRWQRQGDRYAFAWPFAPGTLQEPRGNSVSPSRNGTTLNGTFTGASSYTLPGGGTSTWGEQTVQLTPAGRFEFSRVGGASASNGKTTTTTTYDDDRAISSSTTPGAVIAGRTRTPDTGNRRGSYQIQGYSIVLTYDSGKVERHPFFIDEGGAGIWMFGTRLMRKK